MADESVSGPQIGMRLCGVEPGVAPADTARYAAEAGFDTVVVPADNVPGMDALRAMVTACRARRLRVLVDLPLDRVPVEKTSGAEGLFTILPMLLLDPRQLPKAGSIAVAALSGAHDADAFAAWASGHVDAMRGAGAAGVRLLGLANLPGDVVAPILGQLRTLQPDAVLLAWAGGMAQDVLKAVQPGCVDMVASSFPSWDGHADWFWSELDLLRGIAPVVHPTEGAGKARVALAAMLSEGWMASSPRNPANGADLNRIRSATGFGSGPGQVLGAPGSAVTALLRTDCPDPRQAGSAILFVCNDASTPVRVPAAPILADAGGVFGRFMPLLPPDADPFAPGAVLDMAPQEVRVFAATAVPRPSPARLDVETAIRAARAPRLAIEAPTPCVEGGRFPARRTMGTSVEVQADIIGDGHDKLAVVLRWRAPGGAWQETPMTLINNDRWTASFPLEVLGVHHYEVCAWRDAYTTYTDELAKKHKAGVSIALELREGALLVASAATRVTPAQPDLVTVGTVLASAAPEEQRELLLSAGLAALMTVADERPFVTTSGPIPIQAERTAAGFASWYEVFPRSLSDDPARHGTFKDVERHLPRIAGMGFDVLYFPPIHPIGRVNRKGRNNTLTPGPNDPGSPYAIGSADGGHDALHPELGTLEDFQRLRTACTRHGLELAMDFAIQCSPDHPWLKEHKDWFTWRPDGTIRYAENPPKKYEDIVNVDFYADGAVPGLWVALCQAVLHWAEQGVRLFRVDNPHTKPLPFWEWMIAEVQAQYPDAIFLAEAFTRPKVMYRLAKSGFSQSYTYFTWRERKWEFEQYLTELADGPPRDFFRPHFFVNTPDINPVYLQGAGRSAYLARAALAATLSGLWGVYNGFELCEGTPVPGKEEYLDSEKYQLRAWDWDRPGNIVQEITRLNAIRRHNPALHTHLGITFLPASGEGVLFFEKATPDRDNVVLVAVSLDVSATQTADIAVPGTDAVDLLQDRPVRWADRTQTIVLPPDRPYAIWRLRSI